MNDDSILAVSNEHKKPQKSYHEKLLSTELTWDKNNISRADTIKGYITLQTRVWLEKESVR